jgi:hypothetical protein
MSMWFLTAPRALVARGLGALPSAPATAAMAAKAG